MSRDHVTIALLLCLVPLALCYEFDGTLKIGMSLSLTNRFNQDAAISRIGLGVNVRDGVNATINKFNEDGGVVVRNLRYKLEAVILDDYGFSNSSGRVFLVNNYKSLCQQVLNGQMNLLLGPVSADFSGTAADITEKCGGTGIPLLHTTAATLTGTIAPRQVASLLPPGDASQSSALQLLALNGASTLYVIRETGTAYAFCGGVANNAMLLGLKVMGTSTINATAGDITAGQLAYLEGVLLTAREINADALIVCAFQGSVFPMLKLMKKLDWFPKAVSVVPNNAGFTAEVQKRVQGIKNGGNPDDYGNPEFTLAGTIWHQDANFPASVPWGTVKQFTTSMAQIVGKNEADWSYYAMGAGGVQVAVNTFKTAASFSQPDVQFALSRAQVDTVMGAESFGVSGLSSNSYVCSQWFLNERRVVAPITSRAFVMVYPAPTWREREFHPEFLQSGMEKGIFAFAVISVALLMLLASAIFYYRDQRIIKAASWQMCIIMILGAALTCASVLTWQPYASNALCHAQLWLFGVGEVLWIGSILVKTLRIHKIFNATVLKVSKGTGKMVLAFGVIVGIDVLILLIWSLGFAPVAVEEVVDPYRPALNYLTCRTPSDAIAPVYIAYKVLIVVITTVLAYRVRNVPGEFNESKVIAMGTYNFLLCGLVIIVVVSFGGNSGTEGGRQFIFLFRSIGILVVALADMGIIFGPRLFTIWFDKKMLANMTGANHTVMAMSPSHGKNAGGARYTPNNFVGNSNMSAVDADGGVSRAKDDGRDRVPLSSHLDDAVRATDNVLHVIEHADQAEFPQNKRLIAALLQKCNAVVAHKLLAPYSDTLTPGTPRVVVVGSSPRSATTTSTAAPRSFKQQTSTGNKASPRVSTTGRNDDSLMDFGVLSNTSAALSDQMPEPTSAAPLVPPARSSSSSSPSSDPTPPAQTNIDNLEGRMHVRQSSNVPGALQESAAPV